MQCHNLMAFQLLWQSALHFFLNFGFVLPALWLFSTFPKYRVIKQGYVLVHKGSPGDPVVDIRQNTSSDSRGSPADVSSGNPLICHISEVLLVCATLATPRFGAATFLLLLLCGKYRCILPEGHNLPLWCRWIWYISCLGKQNPHCFWFFFFFFSPVLGNYGHLKYFSMQHQRI